MKLTGELKKQVEKAETIAQAGMLLNDDELDQVSGGADYADFSSKSIRFFCDDCQKGFDVHLQDSKKRGSLNSDSALRTHCPRCKGTNTHKA